LTIVIVELEIFEQGRNVQAIFLAFTVYIYWSKAYASFVIKTLYSI